MQALPRQLEAQTNPSQAAAALQKIPQHRASCRRPLPNAGANLGGLAADHGGAHCHISKEQCIWGLPVQLLTHLATLISKNKKLIVLLHCGSFAGDTHKYSLRCTLSLPYGRLHASLEARRLCSAP